jgi:hypothetical protein
VSGGIVATLMKPYLNKGHCLYTDSYITSSTLSAYLFDDKTNSCGTVQLNRKCMLVLRKKLTRSQTESLASQEMLAVKWRDCREVSVDHNAQRCHGNSQQEGQKDTRVGEEATVCYRLQ